MPALPSVRFESKRNLLFAPAYFVEWRAALFLVQHQRLSVYWMRKREIPRLSLCLGGRSFEMIIKTGGGEYLFSDRPILQRMSDELDLRGSGKFYYPTQLSLGKGGFLLNQQCLANMKSKASFKCIFSPILIFWSITQQRMSTTQQSTWWWMRLVILGRQRSRVQIQGLHSCERRKRRTSASIQSQLQRIQLTMNEEWAEKKNGYLQSFK
jgi:hypothetical protein